MSYAGSCFITIDCYLRSFSHFFLSQILISNEPGFVLEANGVRRAFFRTGPLRAGKEGPLRTGKEGR